MSSGSISNTSTPCNFPMSWKRSRPVDWSSSVGTVPGFPPGPTREGAWASERRAAETVNARTALLLDPFTADR